MGATPGSRGSSTSFEFTCERCLRGFVPPVSTGRLSLGGQFQALAMGISWSLRGNKGPGSAFGDARRRLLAKDEDEAYQTYVQTVHLCPQCGQFVCHECWASSWGSCQQCAVRARAGDGLPVPYQAMRSQTARPLAPAAMAPAAMASAAMAPAGPAPLSSTIVRPVVRPVEPSSRQPGPFRRNATRVALGAAMILAIVGGGMALAAAGGRPAPAVADVTATPSSADGTTDTPGTGDSTMSPGAVSPATASAGSSASPSGVGSPTTGTSAGPTRTPTPTPSKAPTLAPTATPTLAPTITPSSPPTPAIVCNGSTSLSISDATSVSCSWTPWSGSPTATWSLNGVSPSPSSWASLAAGDYTVQLHVDMGSWHQDSNPVSIHVIPTPPVPVITCNGQPSPLTVTVADPVACSYSGGASGGSATWSGGPGDPPYSSLPEGTYTLLVRVVGGGFDQTSAAYAITVTS